MVSSYLDGIFVIVLWRFENKVQEGKITLFALENSWLIMFARD
jgi:hypothetical protein